MSQDIPDKLKVTDATDLVSQIANSDIKPDIHKVEGISDAPVSETPAMQPVITWGQLIPAAINAYLRNYIVNTVTGQIITTKTRFWLGFAAGFMAALLIGFLGWQLTRIF